MTPAETLRTDFTRYAQLIEERLIAAASASAPMAPGTESAATLSVNRGIVLAQSLLPQSPAQTNGDPVARLIELTNSQRYTQVAVVDATGHFRAVYRPLLLYAWMLAFKIRYETLAPDEFGRWDESLRTWADFL